METKPLATDTPEAAEDAIVGNADFDKHLKVFVKSVATVMESAKHCANISILHFAEHGDVSLCQRFLDAMPKNFVRRAAYLQWLLAHSPLKVTHQAGGAIKLSKDKSEKANPYNTEAALKVLFWDFAPDPEDIIVTDEDAFKRFMAAINYFRRKNVKAPDGVKALVNAVENVVVHYQSEAKKNQGHIPAPEASTAITPPAEAEAA